MALQSLSRAASLGQLARVTALAVPGAQVFFSLLLVLVCFNLRWGYNVFESLFYHPVDGRDQLDRQCRIAPP